ncbi:DUF58 domain-containing protein [Teredinibacter purpureus]|uniref:DUF58 domain-containing protein n=1 Tax=Teredinibacter purpureus TaxID=2731756 RepID=UPI0005F7D3AB|nr:DUF58 domain-containing protein [Teredinibacter purpureus]
MRPSKKLLNCVLLWFGSGLVLFAVRVLAAHSPVDTDNIAVSNQFVGLESVWWSVTVALLLIAVMDLFRHRSFKQVSVVRDLPHSMALGVSASVKLELYNSHSFTLTMDLTDMYPHCIVAESLPLRLTIGADCKRSVIYPVMPVKRGEALFGETCLRIFTRWGLWQRVERIGETESVKIYPNFAPIANSASVGLEHQIAQMGIHLQQRRGEGSDFHQLREFREGDSLRQIDWKATSRQRKPISREYQDERDQDIIFMLDCGRRLRNKDDEISHFDHALNALLLTGYVALRQGDAVGMMSFAGEQRWLSPRKGPSRINAMLNQLYDLHSTTQTSDYLQAAEQFLQRKSKRSLVILITNVRDEDVDDLSAAIDLLSKKHIVMVASLRDVFLDRQMEKAVASFSDALTYCGTSDHIQRRRRVLSMLQSKGTIITDSLPETLHLNLVSEYLKLKRSGRL